MVTKHYCDQCGKEAPTEESLKPLIYGDETLCKCCLTCGNTLRMAFKQQIMKTQNQLEELKKQIGAVEEEKTPAKKEPEVKVKKSYPGVKGAEGGKNG